MSYDAQYHHSICLNMCKFTNISFLSKVYNTFMFKIETFFSTIFDSNVNCSDKILSIILNCVILKNVTIK